MRSALRRHFGIEPRRVERFAVAAAAGLLLGALLVLMAGLATAGSFGRHAPRELYYLWLAGLAFAALAAAPQPRLAALLVVLGWVDFGLGTASLGLERIGWGVASVMPPPFHPGGGYRWHPLLQAAPIPSLHGGVGRLRIDHSQAGTRGRDWTAEALAGRTVVAVFGGSTTYDIAVGDGETWPDRLEQLLPGTAVINHGVPGYSTVENLLQTAFYADAFGRRPDCALYYVGWNDLRSAGLPRLDNAYADHHLPSQIDSLKARRISSDFYTVSPLATVAIRLAAIALDTARPAPPAAGAPLDGPDPELERIFLRNVEAISAINRIRGIRTLWVGQLLNVHALDGEAAAGWTPRIRRKDLWPLQARLNRLLRQQAEAQGDVYVDVPVADFSADDFVDSGHFSAAGAARFARQVAPPVRAHCR